MGITIHYQGRARDSKALDALLNDAFRFAAEREWQATIYDDPLGVYEGRESGERPADDEDDRGAPYRGVVAKPHGKCEPVRLDFSPALELSGFTKTGHAPFRIHCLVVAMLRRIAPYMAEFTVVDETGLWESGDLGAARARFDGSTACLEQLAEELKDARGE
jgi:hypothetical protein